jgi:hypothetical protein
LLLFPPRNAYAAIRLDTRASGLTTGYVVRAQHIANTWVITERRRFAVAPRQVEKLDALIAQSRLWRRHARERWPWVEICTDGTEMILERATPEGYGFSEAHTYCSSPADYLAVAAQVVDMTGDADLATWLR